MDAALSALLANNMTYTAKATGATFKYQGFLANGAAAEQVCRSEGGHLASFASLTEQNEVEQYYLQMVSIQQVLCSAFSMLSRTKQKCSVLPSTHPNQCLHHVCT